MDDQGQQSPDEKIWKDHWESVEKFNQEIDQEINSPPTRRVPILVHPRCLLVGPAIGILGMVVFLRDVCSVRDLHLGLLTGFAVSLPTILIQKWILRRYKDLYAELYTAPFSERQSWRFQKASLLCTLPMYLGMLTSMAIDRYLGVTIESEALSVSILFILSILLYPEQKAIWLAAKARLAESENGA